LLTRGSFVGARAEWYAMRLVKRDKQAIEELARRVRARLGPRAVAILFYGSKARGTDSVGSDLDVAVIVDRQSTDLRRAVFEEVSAVILDYEVLLDVHVLEARHLKRLKQEGAPYAMRLESEGVPI